MVWPAEHAGAGRGRAARGLGWRFVPRREVWPPPARPCSPSGMRSGTGDEWPSAPTAGSRITACDREIGHDRDSSGKGLPTAPKAPVMITVLGLLVCLGENPRSGGQRDSGRGALCPLLKWR